MRALLWKPLFLAASLAGGGMSAQAEEAIALAFIDFAPREGGLEISGGALAIGSGVFRGEMTIDRQGASGGVATRQERQLSLQSGEKGEIARIGVSWRSDDRLKITVRIRQGEAVLSEATFAMGAISDPPQERPPL